MTQPGDATWTERLPDDGSDGGSGADCVTTVSATVADGVDLAVE